MSGIACARILEAVQKTRERDHTTMFPIDLAHSCYSRTSARETKHGCRFLYLLDRHFCFVADQAPVELPDNHLRAPPISDHKGALDSMNL